MAIFPWILNVIMVKGLIGAKIQAFEDINYCIQAWNAKLRRLLQDAKKEKWKLRLTLEHDVEEQMEECSTPKAELAKGHDQLSPTELKVK